MDTLAFETAAGVAFGGALILALFIVAVMNA